MASNYTALPYNLEAEQSVLGCVLVDLEIQLEIVASLNEDDFFTESDKLIFGAMKEIARLNKSIDIVTLSDTMEKNATLSKAGGMDYIMTIVQSTPSSANYKQYVDIVKRDSTLRRLIRSSENIAKDARKSTDSKKSLEYAESEIFKISEDNETSSLLPVADNYEPVISEFEKLEKDKNYKQGLKSGFNRLDEIINGFKKGNLIIIAARPGDGKTTLALNMIENITLKETDKVCAMFALEMTREELAQKLLCSLARVRMDVLQKGRLSEEDEDGWQRLWAAHNKLSKAKIYVDDSPASTVPSMISKCRRLKATKGLDLIVVDHLQLIYPDNRTAENRQQEVTEISRGLKVMAKELNVPVIALSQLSRGVTQGGKARAPVLSDLRESGAIEQDADVVMFIHRPDRGATAQEIAAGTVEKNVAQIIVGKNRSGEQGIVKLLFKGEYSKFVNMNGYTPEPPPEYGHGGGNKSNFVPIEDENDPAFDDEPIFDDSDIPPEE